MPVVDVMMGRANQVPYDQQSDMSEIQRRQLLLQQMLKEAGQGAPGTIPNSGEIKVPNYAGAIGKILESVIGVAGAKNAAEDQAKVAANTQRIGAEEAAKYVNMQSGGPVGMMGAGPGDEAGPDMLNLKPNPAGAIREGLGAKTQLVREMARKAQEEKDKLDLAGQIRDMDRLKAVQTGNLLPSSVGPGVDPRSYRLAPKISVVDSMINQNIPGEPGAFVPPTPGVRYGAPNPATPTMPAYAVAEGTNEPKALGAGSLRQEPINATALELGKASVDSLVKRVSESYGKLLPAVNNAQYLVDAIDVLDKAYVGKPWSALELPVQKALMAMGIKPDADNRIPSTEMITPMLGAAAFDMLKALRPASDNDVQWVGKLLAINPVNDPETTKQVVRTSIAAMMNDYMAHGKSLSAMGEFGKMPEFEKLIPAIQKQYELPTMYLDWKGKDSGIDIREGGPAHARPMGPRSDAPKRIKYSDLP